MPLWRVASPLVSSLDFLLSLFGAYHCIGILDTEVRTYSLGFRQTSKLLVKSRNPITPLSI